MLAVPVMALLRVRGPVLLPEFRDPRAATLHLISAGMSVVAVLAASYGRSGVAATGRALDAAVLEHADHPAPHPQPMTTFQGRFRQAVTNPART